MGRIEEALRRTSQEPEPRRPGEPADAGSADGTPWTFDEEAGAEVGFVPGAGGRECIVAAPTSAYDEMVGLARECGFFA